MFADDLPDGAWTAALIGAYWPGVDAVEVLGAGADARHRWATHFDGYADHLRSVNQTLLSGQEGATADAARALFTRGEHRARASAERNGVSHRSYGSVRQCVAELREELARIAEDGNAAIGRIQDSPIPVEAKVTGITEVIAEAQARAHGKTAENAGNVLSHIQTVLDAHGADVSARAFAASHGVDPTPPRPPSAEVLTQQVTGALTAAAGGVIEASLAGTPELAAAPAEPATVTPMTPMTAPPNPLAASASAPVSAPAVAPPPLAAVPVPPGGPHTPTGPNHPGAAVTSTPGAATALNPSNATTTTATSALIRRSTALAAATAERAHAAAAPDRLTPLLAALARQIPELSWAVGERTDGVIVAVTDLAGGWIPPSVTIPAGVRLPEPRLRSGELADLLGDCPNAACYTPGQHLPPPVETVAMSTLPREAPATDDLGWELTRATKWRDGLPRLAHTLARAAISGTGCPDSEVALLGGHLHVVGTRVLAAYPDSVSAADVGNWQLLAAIEALVNNQAAAAAYHFAWFQVQP